MQSMFSSLLSHLPSVLVQCLTYVFYGEVCSYSSQGIQEPLSVIRSSREPEAVVDPTGSHHSGDCMWPETEPIWAEEYTY